MGEASNLKWLDYFFDNIWCDEDNTWYLDEKGKSLSKDLPAKLAITAKINEMQSKAAISAIEQLQRDIVEVDRYHSDVDQQAWAYARVHRLAQDRIAELRKRKDEVLR